MIQYVQVVCVCVLTQPDDNEDEVEVVVRCIIIIIIIAQWPVVGRVVFMYASLYISQTTRGEVRRMSNKGEGKGRGGRRASVETGKYLLHIFIYREENVKMHYYNFHGPAWMVSSRVTVVWWDEKSGNSVCVRMKMKSEFCIVGISYM